MELAAEIAHFLPGLKVVLADIEEEALAGAVSQLSDQGHSVLGVRTDVSKLSDVEALAEATIKEFNAVHVLCNNAGVGVGAPGL